MDQYSMDSGRGSGGCDSVFLDQQIMTPSSLRVASANSSRGSSSANSPTSHLSADSSPSGSTCRHSYASLQQARSPRLSSSVSTVTSGSEASASSSGSSRSSSSHSSAGWGTLAKHRPLKTSSSTEEDSLAKVLERLPHTSQSLRHVVSNLSRTYDDDVLANVQQFNEQAKAAENSDAPRPHLKLRRQTQEMQVVESLQEFWSLKALETTRTGDGYDVQDSTVVYEMLQPSMHQHGFVAFAFLPGGSCFRSLAVCSTRGEARRSAAEVALMNSVHNELPTRKLSTAYIKTLLNATHDNSGPGRHGSGSQSAYTMSSLAVDDNSSVGTSSSNADRTSWKSADILAAILESNKGSSLLSCKESLVVFQLLQWSGILRRAKSRGLPLSAVIQSALATSLGKALRQRCSTSWTDKESEQRGTIARELQSTKRDLERLCIAGRETRFAKEKKDILVAAYAEYQRRQQTQSTMYDTPTRLLAEYQQGSVVDSPRRSASQRSLAYADTACSYQPSMQSSRPPSHHRPDTACSRTPYVPMSARRY